MASPAGRGAQVRLDGDEQAAARGALHGRLADNIASKHIIEDSGISAGGNGPDGSFAGTAALDEVLTPAGRIGNWDPSKLPGAPPGTTPGTTLPDGGSTGGGTGGGTGPSPSPAPTTAIRDRGSAAITLRSGAYLEFRTATVVPPGPTITPPPQGGLGTRANDRITTRSGNVIMFRTVADSAPPDVILPPPDEPPPPPPVIFPSTAYLFLTQTNANVLIESQDGINATVRVVRPVFINEQLFSVQAKNNTVGIHNTFWGNKFGYLVIQNGQPATERDILSTDDGTYSTILYQGRDDGTFLQLNLTWKVSPSATGTPPAPSAVPDRMASVFFEDFLPMRGVGALSRAYGNVVNTGNSTILIQGIGSAMTQTSSDGSNSPAFGYGNGLYEFRVRYIGSNIGDGSGPVTLLWPASDVWPGPEIDLGELMADGTFYTATHWLDPTFPNNNGQRLEVPPPFNYNDWFVTAVRLTTTSITYYINGVAFATYSGHPAPDRAHGGENHTVGIASNSTNTGIECDWIRWTPEALLPPL